MSSQEAKPLALILDDSPCLALQLSRQLAGLGLRAQALSDFEELRTQAGNATVILVELELFKANGFQVTRTLAADLACPLILLTGTGRDTDLHWGLRAGASAVLARPVAPEALRSALRLPELCGLEPA